MHQPLISVCIPTYNRATCLYHSLTRTIESWEGNYEDLEIIVSDNNSSDNTGEIVKKINDQRIKYYKNKENVGGTNNFKLALDRGCGKFLCLMSDEDFIKFDIKSLNAIASNPSTAVFVEKTSLEYSDSNQKELLIDKELNQVLFKHTYMSGYIYNGDYYHNFSSKNPDYVSVDYYYPHEYICYKLYLYGQLKLINKRLVEVNTYENPHEQDVYNPTAPGSFRGLIDTFKDRLQYLFDGTISIEYSNQILTEEFLHKIVACSIIKNLEEKTSVWTAKKQFESEIFGFINSSSVLSLVKNDQLEKGFYHNSKIATIKLLFKKVYGTNLYYWYKKIEAKLKK